MPQDIRSLSVPSESSLWFFLRMGARNIFRRPSRAMLGMTAIGVSVALVIISTTWMAGVERQVFSELTNDAGHVAVARQIYFDRSRFNPLRYSVADAGKLQTALRAVEGVRAVTQRIEFGMVAARGELNKEVVAAGVDVESFRLLSSLPNSLVAGRFMLPGERGLLLGLNMANDLGVRPGDVLDLIGRTAHQSLTADGFKVVGIYDLGSKRANRVVYMPLEAAQDLLDMQGTASRLLVYGKDFNEADQLGERIEKAKILPAGVALRRWYDDRFLAGTRALLSGVGYAVVVIICVVAGFGILNMMMVYVLERRREIGVLKAMGMRHRAISACFLYEATLYGVLGSTVGVILGVPAALYLDRVGVAFTGMEGMPVTISRMYGHFSINGLLAGLGVGVLLGILGMLLPVLRSYSIRPLDAIRRL